MRLSTSLHPAYHLRPNKAVDRLLLVELLRALQLSDTGLPEVYIGLGGPFLEDFRLISSEFPELELVCIESDRHTYKRQEFHSCSSRLVCLHATLEQYIANCFPSDRPVAVWADFTTMSRQCLSEFSDMVRKAVPGSLLRMTVRAESPVFDRLGISPKKFPGSVPRKRKMDFEKMKNSYRVDMAVHGVAFRDEWFDWHGFSTEGFPQILANMIEATAQAACTSPKAYVPVHTVKYSDGTIMLSKTGIVCSEEDRLSLAQHFRKSCAFCADDPTEVEAVDVPVLTTKERLHLEQVVPVDIPDGTACQRRLGYLIEGEGSEVLSLQKLAQYERFHKLYPHFGKMVP